MRSTPWAASRRVGIAALATLAALVFPPGARAEVDDISIAAFREDRTGTGEQWFFEVFVEGGDLGSASVTIPGAQGRLENLTGDAFELAYTDAVAFDTFAQLLARNPAGAYTVTVTDGQGTKSVTLDWSPTAPVNGTGGEAFLRLAFPVAQPTLGCATPDVTYTTNCANCPLLEVELNDQETEGEVVELRFSQQGAPFPNPVPFRSLTDPVGMAASPLPDGNYDLEVLAGFVDVEFDVPFDSGPADPFTYVQEASLVDLVPFAVAQQPLDLEEILIAGIRLADEGPIAWKFEIEAFGHNVCSMSVDTPAPNARTLHLAADASGDFGFEAGPFQTFAELQAENGPGTYSFTVNEAYAVDLVWDPTEPQGASGQASISVTSPVDDSTHVSPTPEAAYALDCSNCQGLFADLSALPGDLECSFAATPVFPNPIPFSSFEFEDTGASCPALPNGQYELRVLAGFATFTTEMLVPTLDAFQYVDGAVVADGVEFWVPEPGAGWLALAGLGTAVALARRRRSPNRLRRDLPDPGALPRTGSP